MLTFKLAWRSVWRHKWRSAITIFAIGSALFLTVFMTALGDGMYRQMIHDAVRMSPGHLVLEHEEYRDEPAVDLTVTVTPDQLAKLNADERVVSTKVLIMAQGVAKTGRATTGIAIMGVEPDSEKKTSTLVEKIIEGEYLAPGDKRKTVIGYKMAERLKVKVGKKIVLASTNKDGDMVEELVRVKGIFRTGSAEIDGHMLQVTAPFARKMLGLAHNESNQVGVILKTDDSQEEFRPVMAALANGSTVLQPWQIILSELTNYVKIDRVSNQVFQGIIIFISLFTIFNTLLMSVIERKREFAMMRAVGTSISRVRKQVMAESFFIGSIGTLGGMFGGWALSLYLGSVGMDLTAMYGEDLDVSGFAINPMIYPYIAPDTLVSLAALVGISVMLVSLIAIRHISKIRIADVLR